ncbi:MAG: hypothetical protein QOH48_1434 [Actinomycetota bacterium]|jgi:hypothetical protein|nr:hypothetical protein [Actinomycetota bacterium]
MNVERVHAYANGLAHAVVDQNSDLISSYLSKKAKGNIAEVLGGLPRRIGNTEVLSVTEPAHDECISLTRFNGFRGRGPAAGYLADEPQPLICRAQLV